MENLGENSLPSPQIWSSQIGRKSYERKVLSPPFYTNTLWQRRKKTIFQPPNQHNPTITTTTQKKLKINTKQLKINSNPIEKPIPNPTQNKSKTKSTQNQTQNPQKINSKSNPYVSIIIILTWGRRLFVG